MLQKTKGGNGTNELVMIKNKVMGNEVQRKNSRGP